MFKALTDFLTDRGIEFEISSKTWKLKYTLTRSDERDEESEEESKEET